MTSRAVDSANDPIPWLDADVLLSEVALLLCWPPVVEGTFLALLLTGQLAVLQRTAFVLVSQGVELNDHAPAKAGLREAELGAGNVTF